MKKQEILKHFLWICMGMMLGGCQKEAMELSWDAAQEVTDQEMAESETEDDMIQTEETIFVHVCGAVNNPGVYELSVSSRIVDAVEAAGGFAKEAALDQINLAAVVRDGDQIRVWTQQELEKKTEIETENLQEGLLDLNRATLEQLMELPGIGQAKAEAILSYREQVGKFQTIEELKNVSGIKESIFEKVKDKIIVH
ncbi:MAG: helix-hairpin-helix domain-containing protein [Lachnospiraceae bacterium]|nr:helix-hairpin-helix domain-containing protein [Lachnospiraceae bacterium]